MKKVNKSDYRKQLSVEKKDPEMHHEVLARYIQSGFEAINGEWFESREAYVGQVEFWADHLRSFTKSLHGWIKIDGITTLEQWREWVQPQLFRRILDPMGFDPACKNAGRLSRTVGHVRDNGNTQKLLYLAPASKNRTE